MKRIAVIFLILGFALSAFAGENALRDMNRIPSILGEYNSGTKRVQLDANGAIIVIPDGKTGIVVTDDASIKSSAGTLYYYRVEFSGVSIDDTVQFENAVTSDGTSLSTATAYATHCTIPMASAAAIEYATGIYCDVSLTGGNATVSIIYK